MTAPRTGSRYELQVDRAGAQESKVERDYYAIHAADIEDIAEEDDLIGYVHSYEVGSTVDGPGLRFVAFLTGCLLRCQYCHNPDTWHKRNGHPVSVSQAMKTIGKYAKVLKISKGGITLSGGEPMVQRPFMARIFRRCKELGPAHLPGHRGPARRAHDRRRDHGCRPAPARHQVGRPGDLPEGDEPAAAADARLRAAPLRHGRPMWIRYVLVPDLTDGFDNVEKVADFCAGLKSVERGRDPALPSTRQRQVDPARHRVPAGEDRVAERGAHRAGAPPVPRAGG
jgi:pyruvate formate lyase activating enzyme